MDEHSLVDFTWTVGFSTKKATPCGARSQERHGFKYVLHTELPLPDREAHYSKMLVIHQASMISVAATIGAGCCFLCDQCHLVFY